MIYQLLAAGLFLTSCSPQEAFIAQEVLHEASVAEQAIEADLSGPTAPPYKRKEIDDRTAPKVAKRLHDDVTRPQGKPKRWI